MSHSTPVLDVRVVRAVRERARDVFSADEIPGVLIDALQASSSTETIETQLEHAKRLLVAAYQSAGVKPRSGCGGQRELQPV